MQKGQSKRRGHAFQHIKPLIGMSDMVFLVSLDAFRTYLKSSELPMEALTSKLNRGLSNRTKELFPVDQERSGTHVNRAIYAAMVRYNLRNGMKKASAPRAVQQALGHDKMSSSLHYLYVEIDEKGFSKEVL